MLRVRMASRRVREQQTDRQSMQRSNGNTRREGVRNVCAPEAHSLKDRLGAGISDRSLLNRTRHMSDIVVWEESVSQASSTCTNPVRVPLSLSDTAADVERWHRTLCDCFNSGRDMRPLTASRRHCSNCLCPPTLSGC